ncbi:hypothetical protein ABK040_003466 [Willaertia magna]
MVPNNFKFFVYNPMTKKFDNTSSSHVDDKEVHNQSKTSINANKTRKVKSRRGINKKSCNRLKEPIPDNYSKVTSQWDKLEIENIEIFNEYVMNGFYNIES